MQGHQDFDKKLLVLWLQRKGKSIDDAAKDFKKLSYAIELLCLVNKSAIVYIMYVLLRKLIPLTN